MKPKRGSSTVEIPVSFGVTGGRRAEASGVWLWLSLIGFFWFIISVFAIVAGEGVWKLFVPVFMGILSFYTIRFIIMREAYYKKKRKELIENEYQFGHSIFWDVMDISERYPYVATYRSGMKAIFVSLAKDVVVGKGDDYAYDHHEAIADAYQQMQKRGISAIHVDYMDTVGKDQRLGSLFSLAEGTKNDDLRKVMMHIFDNIEFKMNKAYASYDTYAFFSTGREDIFWEELQIVLAEFRKANYIRASVLNRDEIGHLAQSLMNIDEFSVNKAVDSLMKEMHKTQYIRPIWVERNGERTILNKTREEMTESNRVRKSEKGLKRKKLFNFKRKGEVEPELNLFGTDSPSEEEDSVIDFFDDEATSSVTEKPVKRIKRKKTKL